MYRSRLAFALAMAALAAVLLPSSLPAQITFQRTYGGTDDDEGYAVRQTTDGGYIVAGETRPFGVGWPDVYLVKTDSAGDTLWTRNFGGSDVDCGYSVQPTTDDGFIVAGSTHSYGAGFFDVYFVKTDACGDTQWIKTYGGVSDDLGNSVQQTTDGGYVVGGATDAFGAGSFDVYLVKTDANGDTLWTRAYGGVDEDWAQSVQQTTDGSYIVIGNTLSFGAGRRDVYIVKADANGDTLWTRTVGGTNTDLGWSVQQTNDGGYVIAGTTYSFGAGDEDVYLIRTDAIGDTLWTKTFGGTGGDGGYSVQQTADSGYMVAGWTGSSGAGDNDVWLFKTDPHGDTLWTRTFGGAGGDWATSVDLTTDGGYIIAGGTTSFGAGLYDVFLIKTDSLGNVAVEEPKTSPTRAPALSLSCEPNPCRGATRISLKPQASSSKPQTLRVYDARGCHVRTLTVNRTPCSVWDGTDELGQPLPSGAYFIRCDIAGEHATARIVLQR